MPKPLLLSRPSGPYVRFLIPAALRALVGARFLVRPLGVPHGDAARLVAARMGVALSYAFDGLRRGQVVDLKKALEAARTAGRRDLTLERERLADGTIRERWQMDTPEDVALFRQIQAGDELEGIGVIPEAVALQQAAAEAKAKGPTLSEAIAAHLGDLGRARRDQKTVMESRHSLRILLGVVGDMPAADLGTERVRAFLDAVRHWPRNASKREPYKGRTVRQVLKLSKAAGEPEPAAHTLNKHRQRLSAFIQHLLASRILQHNPLQGVARMTSHATSWSGWGGWNQYGSWATISNTCADACVVPSPNPEVQRQDGTVTRIVDCSAGQFGQINQSRPQHRTRTRTRTWSCPSPTGSPTNSGWSGYGSWTQTGSWTETSRTCASCGTPTPRTRLNWQDRSSACPSGQTGSITWQEQRNQSQSGTYNCPAGTRIRPLPTWSGTWVNGSWTGNTRNPVNTCKSTVAYRWEVVSYVVGPGMGCHLHQDRLGATWLVNNNTLVGHGFDGQVYTGFSVHPSQVCDASKAGQSIVVFQSCGGWQAGLEGMSGFQCRGNNGDGDDNFWDD